MKSLTYSILSLLAASGAFAAETVQGPVTIGSGDLLDVFDPSEINTSGTVQIVDGGNATLWSGTKIRLLPGFTASPNSSGYIIATVSSLLDTDSDGMYDVWETIYGLNPSYSGDASLDSDGDGYTNLQEFQQGKNPFENDVLDWFVDPVNPPSVPSGNALLIVDPDGDLHAVDTPEMTLTVQ